jgi:hypothetical protein
MIRRALALAVVCIVSTAHSSHARANLDGQVVITSPKATPTASNPDVSFTPAADADFHDPTNAALLYYRAMLLLPDDVSKMAAEAVSADNPNWLPDAELSRKLAQVSDVASTLIRAAKIDACDFGVEYSQGAGALLPHLGKLRAAARYLAADSRRLLQEQKPDDAADRIVAMFAMSRHLSHERLMISALVANAIHTLACAQVDHLVNSGQLTSTAKSMLMNEMDRSNGPDPFGIKGAVLGERYWVVVWIRAKVAGPGGPKAFTDDVLPLLDDQPDSADVKAIKAMDAAAINADLDKSEKYYSAVLDVFDLPDAETRLGALEKGAKDGDYGIIAKHAAPALVRVHQQYIKAAARQAETRTHLQNALARPN